MLSANNILSRPRGADTVPTQDMVFGAYYLTLAVEGPRQRSGLRHSTRSRGLRRGDIDCTQHHAAPAPGSSLAAG